MDTIQVSIILNEEKIKGLNPFDLQRVRKDIKGIRSPYGYTYCDCLEISKNTNFIVKISYPRFFAGVNAFLISDKTQCTQVQWDFSLNLNNHPVLCDAQIKLDRVDIPFTFIMGPDYDFNSYRKVYQVFDYVYRKKNSKSNPKAYTNVSEYKPETIIYSDQPQISKYNKRIMFYDQYNNLRIKTEDDEKFHEMEMKYDELSRRMRIETSSRISRLAISIQEFADYPIFSTYLPQFKEHILQNLFDLNEVSNFYNEKSVELANKILRYREETTNFLYETFIYKEVERIHDYEIIRRALKICIDNIKTREKAITVIRKVLFKYQLHENVIVMDTYNTIVQMKRVIETYYRDI